MAVLLFDWFGFGKISKSIANCNVSKTNESKPVKQEVSCSVILALTK